MKKLAMFDVDYTLTSKETMIEFYKFMLKRNIKYIKNVPATTKASLLYLVKDRNLKLFKESFMSFIQGITEEEMDQIVQEFYEKRIKNILYKDGIEMLKQLKYEGYDVYLISASPEFYLKTLYEIKEVDMIIGTRYKVDNGIYTSRIVGENCKGQEKVIRLKSYLESNGIEVDYKNSFMFSDSLSDLPLLRLAGKSFLINFKNGKGKDSYSGIGILNWK
ncbi:HAD-IB family hydrolase [Clostridium oryzae]|uniref:Haloacid dehalogenase-like hydrolase n=1 Tax=Clostridium oryzae TaxID=1450648 RepID=A0A1V4ILE4_9CLOT|nr:HAD-IB family hydrolase [Clostridium oryzae]OPJ60858.1 hypothetical protein CLORY_25650 [Clostridium oryzae]